MNAVGSRLVLLETSGAASSAMPGATSTSPSLACTRTFPGNPAAMIPSHTPPARAGS